MTDIKELALKVAKEFTADVSTHDSLVDFAARLIAAYLAEQEPVGWLRAGRFFYADDPMYKNNHKGMREVIAAQRVIP